MAYTPGCEAEPTAAGCARFRVFADPSPQLLLRIFGLLAQQGRMPDQATVEVARGQLEVALATRNFPRHRAEILAEKIRSMVGTRSVELAWQA